MIAKMDNKRKKRIKLGILAVAIILCVALVVIFTTNAIFTSVRNAQRTIAAYNTEGDRFSSNYLLKGNLRDNVRTVYTTDSGSDIYAVITVCNYQQGRQTLPYEDTINYTLTARLVKYDDATVAKYVPVDAAYISAQSLTSYTITISDGTTTHTIGNTTLSDTFSATLTGGTANSKAYTVNFSSDFLSDPSNPPNLYLELSAVPNIQYLPTISGVFKPELRAAGATDNWTGSFRDNQSSAPSAYDGYNYQITGTGSGTATISWDATKVTLSDVSLDLLLSIDGSSKSGNSITFPVDSDVESRYDLQFYKKNITSETWVQMASQVITLSFS
ncbi:MAG: hypothetical protein J5852_01125 [Clostridia bacterium]|nr:hypothetical protein [Clostridia bacterium]